jgi:CRISPR-associated protein Cas5d
MFHGFTYPDESNDGKLSARMWYPVMRHGVIEFIRPEECSVIREIKSQLTKKFVPGENLGLAEEGMQ